MAKLLRSEDAYSFMNRVFLDLGTARRAEDQLTTDYSSRVRNAPRQLQQGAQSLLMIERKPSTTSSLAHFLVQNALIPNSEFFREVMMRATCGNADDATRSVSITSTKEYS